MSSSTRRLYWLAGLLSLSAVVARDLHAQTACANTPAYSPCETVFTLSDADAARFPNPYTGVNLQVEFRSPHQRTYAVPAFWDGGRKLVVRFAPAEAGQWDFLVDSNIAAWNGQTGSFMAAASDSPGFIRPANVHHWAYTEKNASGIERAHLWMGAAQLDLASLDDAAFRALADARAAQKFNHVRFLVLDQTMRTGPEPDLARFRRIDQRVAYLNQKGIVADLILAEDPATLVKVFPAAEDRQRFARYVLGRYDAFNVTWQVVNRFEDDPDARAIVKDMGEVLKTDGYEHPRTAGARVTSAPFLDDKWMTYSAQGTSDDVVGSIEHQLYPVPFVNLAATPAADAAVLRRELWNATMDGQSPTYSGSADPKAFSVWFDILSGTRYWELEPYFDLDGGRAVALEGVEYLVYIEKPGPLELRLEKHGYDVLWINPIDGEVTRQKFNGDHFTAEPPDQSHDWVLHVVREGRVESMNKSYRFASRDILMQEIEVVPDKTPFEIEQPPMAASLKVGEPVGYAAKIKRDSRATRSMMWMWTGEVAADGQGYRVLGTGQTGTFAAPATLAKNYPAVVNLRLYAMNGNGKVYALDRVLQLNR
ncbi:MAG TPA: DUF5060 domain-containing protein [Bryobacteraceae bacterium]|nr:DUF5060 domain-containing protein [Bryobacteraceae bacterium]